MYTGEYFTKVHYKLFTVAIQKAWENLIFFSIKRHLWMPPETQKKYGSGLS